MAGDRCYLQAFSFSDGTFEEKVIWESDIINNNISKFPTKDIGGSVEVGVPYYDSLPSGDGFTILGKMSLDEIKADRVKRSRDHFKKEVWDTIPRSEQKLFRHREDLKGRI